MLQMKTIQKGGKVAALSWGRIKKNKVEKKTKKKNTKAQNEIIILSDCSHKCFFILLKQLTW